MSAGRGSGASGGRGRAGWLAAYGPITALAFPLEVGGVVVDLGLWLGPLSVAAFALGLRGRAPARAAGAGFAAAWLAHAAVLSWIYVAMTRYGGASPAVGVAAVAAIAVYPAAVLAAIAAVIAWLEPRGRATPLAIALLFAAGDHLRTHLASGFPWALLGYTQLDDGVLLPLARHGGVYLVGFGVALTGALLAAALERLRSDRPGAPGLGTGAAVWALLVAAGLLSGATAEPPAGAPIRVAAIQGNVDQGRKWSAERFHETLRDYAAMSAFAAESGAELIVWPETAVPGILDPSTPAWPIVSELARTRDVALIVGAVGAAPGRFGGPGEWFDSAFVFEPDGGLAGRYDKTKLVPFGEYVPLRAWLGGFFEAVARGVARGDVSAGPRPLALRVYVPDRGGGAGGAVRVGVPICYELLFPDRMRRFAEDGAELLVAITNDAWYGRTGAPHQFLAITAMRAVESGLPLVRTANTGVSAIIEANGRIRSATSLFERSVLIADVAPRASGATTFYTRHGDVFALGCWGALAVAVGTAARRGRHDAPADRGDPRGPGAAASPTTREDLADRRPPGAQR